MKERLRGAFVPFVTGVLLTVVGVFVIQSLSPGTLAKFFVQLPTFDPGAWLSNHTSRVDPGAWLKDHKDELPGVGALAAGVGVLIAGVGLLISARAQRLAARAQRLAAFTSSWNSSRDCLWNFNGQWKDLYKSRTAADQFLKTMQSYERNEALFEVLNFFEKMAFMGNRGHLDDELAWTNYFDEAYDLWKRAAGYILWWQGLGNDPTLWCEYGPWVVRLAGVDTKRKEVAMRHLATRPELSVARPAPSATPVETVTRPAPSATLVETVTRPAPSSMPVETVTRPVDTVTRPAPSATPADTVTWPAPPSEPSKAPTAETPIAKTSAGVDPAEASDLHAVGPEVPGTQATRNGAPSDEEPPASSPSASEAKHPPEGPKNSLGN